MLCLLACALSEIILLPEEVAGEAVRCAVPGSFTNLDLQYATMIRSNLGGQGGRCSKWNRCEEPETAETPHEIRIADVGVHRLNGKAIDLRITNESEYFGYNTDVNGISVRSGGSFGVINLRAPSYPPASRYWNQDYTYVQLNFTFIDGSTMLPLTIDRAPRAASLELPTHTAHPHTLPNAPCRCRHLHHMVRHGRVCYRRLPPQRGAENRG